MKYYPINEDAARRAKEEARKLSVEHPGILYRVIDKPRKRACVTGSEWIYRERVLEGWHTCCEFRDGRQL